MVRHYLDSLAYDIKTAESQRAVDPLVDCFLQGVQTWRLTPDIFLDREDEFWSMLRAVDEELQRRGYRPQQVSPWLAAQLTDVFGENNWVVEWARLNDSQQRDARSLCARNVVGITEPHGRFPVNVVVDSRQLCWTLARCIVPGID